MVIHHHGPFTNAYTSRTETIRSSAPQRFKAGSSSPLPNLRPSLASRLATLSGLASALRPFVTQSRCGLPGHRPKKIVAHDAFPFITNFRSKLLMPQESRVPHWGRFFVEPVRHFLVYINIWLYQAFIKLNRQMTTHRSHDPLRVRNKLLEADAIAPLWRDLRKESQDILMANCPDQLAELPR